jgi:hypothetical protein
MATPELHTDSQPARPEDPSSARMRLSRELGEILKQKDFTQMRLREITGELIAATDGHRDELLQFHARLSDTLLDLELRYDQIIREITATNFSGYTDDDALYRRNYGIPDSLPQPDILNSGSDFDDED